MNWINFIHLYQPIQQQPDILNAIIEQSYRPLLKTLSEKSGNTVTLNITGSLLELFDKYGHTDLIDYLKTAVKNNSISLTGSSKYHCFLPMLPSNEIERQIGLNTETLEYYIQKDISLDGFFPPEMAVSEQLLSQVSELGFKWCLVDSISLNVTKDLEKLYITDKGLYVLPRDRNMSNLIMSSTFRSSSDVHSWLQGIPSTANSCIVSGMDGETFGHHRVGLENLFQEIYHDDSFNMISPSDYIKSDITTKAVSILESTWASSPQDLVEGTQFLSWKDPSNSIHEAQWKLFYLVLGTVEALDKSNSSYDVVRHALDTSLASDHFWWASAKPWWSVEMIEDGAFRLINVLMSIHDIDPSILNEANSLYQKIVSTSFEWQRTGKIRKMHQENADLVRIPFKERTYESNPHEKQVYLAFIDMMKKQESVAALKGDYERAILWRDAVYKLDHKHDIYDAINVIDLLRVELGNDHVEKVIDSYTKDFKNIRGGQPEQRGR